jgi:hypothetical protein
MGTVNLEESADELPNLQTAVASSTWEAVDTAIKQEQEVDVQNIVAGALVDEPASEETPQLLGAPADVQWPWAAGEGPVVQPTANTGVDDFKRQMHKLEQRVHHTQPPERQPASLHHHLVTGGPGEAFTTTSPEDYQTAFEQAAEFLDELMGE